MKLEDLYLITENPFVIQKKCQNHGRGIFLMFFLGMVLYYMVADLVPEILGVILPKGYLSIILALNDIPAGTIDLSKVNDVPVVVILYAVCFNGVLETCKALYALTFIRNRKVDYGALCEGFAFVGKAIVLSILQTIIISIWTFFFILPGIVASYNFRQSYYILADNPEKGIFQILAESKTRMIGNRFTLFKLDLSYFTIFVMGYFPVIFFETMKPWTDNLIVDAIAGFAFSLPLYYAFSIMLMGRTVFYELLIQHGFDNFKYVGQDAFRAPAFSEKPGDEPSEEPEEPETTTDSENE